MNMFNSSVELWRLYL